MRNRFSLLLGLIALIAVAMPSGARAEWQSYDCQGGYLVGFNAMAGDWVDRIGAICAPWVESTQQLGTPVEQQPLFATSGGGGGVHTVCPPTTVVTGIFFYLPTKNGQKVAQDVTLTCKRVTSPHDVMSFRPTIATNGDHGSDGQEDATGSRFWNSEKGGCPDGQGATGFQADVGQYVGSIGIHCKPWPAAAAPPVAAAPPAAPRPVIPHLGHPRPPSSAPVQGSWFYSCSNASLYGNVLSASCKSTTGLDVATSLDLTTCNQPATAANINGKLVCENGVAAPGGGAPAPTPAPAPGPGPVASVPPSNVIEGDWKSSEGPMSFTQNGHRHLDSTYAQDSGRIRAEREHGHWVGFWSESKSNHKCNHPRLGSDYWGQMDFVFTDGNRHFEGMWSYCDAPTAGGSKWTGDRIK